MKPVQHQVRSKYGAKRTQVDGITFDSKAEADRYVELRALQEAGQISGLVLQPSFVLAGPVRYTGAARAKPALVYRADFEYVDHLGRRVVEDVKGRPTEAYIIKRHLMLAIHGIEVSEHRRKAKRAA